MEARNITYLLKTEEIKKIASSANKGNRMQSVDLIEAYVNGTREDLVCI